MFYSKNRTSIILLGLLLIILINLLLSELLNMLESYTNWYINYDVELTNLVLFAKVLSSIIIIFFIIRKIHSKR